MKKAYLLGLIPLIYSFQGFAAEEEEQLQDMSDPLAVFTQAGVGITDKGINFKVGQTYDTGNPETAAMHVVELKGIGGDMIGIRDQDDFSTVDDSIDSFRYRNFSANMKNGSGAQIDINYTADTDSLTGSYSILQALPKMGMFQFFPLAGLGLDVRNRQIINETTGATSNDGYHIEGAFALVGMYAKITLTDNIWINYNPMYMTALSGSDNFEENAYGAGNSDILTHEFAISYQINTRTNVRYFANWNENVDFADGDHRIEVNYQF